MLDKNEVFTIDMPCFEDDRGFLSIIYDKEFPIDFKIKQINQGYSKSAYTLRGMHFQQRSYSQAKLVNCINGKIFSVAVDLRNGDTFGYAYSAVLSSENHKMMYIPRDFAHGYLTLTDNTLMQWCTDNDFCKSAAMSVRYDDNDIIWKGKSWPAEKKYTLSEKDRCAMSLRNVIDLYK